MSNNLVGALPFPLPTIPKPPSAYKLFEDPAKNKAAPPSSVSFVYQAKVLSDTLLSCNITATWGKNLINHSLNILVEIPDKEETPYTCNIDLKAWQKKGLKSFEVAKTRVDVFWDFRQAKFSNGREPCSDYYVALVSNKEVVLLLGDMKNEALKRTRLRQSLEEATLLYKKENVYGKKLFCTRAILYEGKEEHDIMIENSLSGPGDPEMWISIDGMVVIRIVNLNWRFRGNEIVMVNNMPLQIFWDVHDWLFNDSTPNSGQALFIFKPSSLMRCASFGSDGDHHDESSLQGSLSSSSSMDQFCYFLYASKIE